MAEYIDKEIAIKTVIDSFSCYFPNVTDAVRKIPAADVQPVSHGRWIPQGDDMWLCSNCKENIIFSMSKSDRTEKQRYCCRCGARMDGGIDG